MKTRLLSTITVLLCTITFNSFASTQCGPRYLGQIIVVDEDNNYLIDAEIYRYNTVTDSTIIGWRYSHMYADYSKDTATYVYESWFYSSDDEPAKYRYGVYAKGYAPLYLKNIKWPSRQWKDTNFIYPVLYITMHAAKFVKTKNQISKISAYKYEETLTAKDTVHFNIQESKEYKEATRQHTYHSGLKTEYFVKTYPNPVIEEVVVTFKQTPLLPQQMELFTIEGKKIKSFKLSETDNRINLNWLSKGVFLIILYDEENNPIHQEKLTKI